jgi:hypothetical protein
MSAGDVGNLNDAADARNTGPPPLRIHHLLACAVVVGVQLSLWRAFFPADANQPGIYMTMAGIGLTFSAIGATMALFSIWWQIIGRRGLTQPGQWLFFTNVLSLIGWLSGMMAYYWLREVRYGSGATWGGRDILLVAYQTIVFALQYGLPLILFSWCAWKVADSLPWRMYFVLLAIGPLLFNLLVTFWGTGMPTAYILLHLARTALGLLFLLTAVAQEIAAHRARYWTHWLGIGLTLLGNVFGLVANGLHAAGLF